MVAQVGEADDVVARLAVLCWIGFAYQSSSKTNFNVDWANSHVSLLQIEDYLDKHDGGDDFDPQPLGEEGALLGVDLDKLGLKMLLGQDAQVLVDYLKGESNEYLDHSKCAINFKTCVHKSTLQRSLPSV